VTPVRTARSRRSPADPLVLATTATLAATVAVFTLSALDWPASAAWSMVMLLPVLLPLPGLLGGRRRTHAWATLCVAPYFVYGITEVVANPAARPGAAVILFASLAWFVALARFLRLTRPDGDPEAAQGTRGS
jgi:uncharacterized membrane protein